MSAWAMGHRSPSHLAGRAPAPVPLRGLFALMMLLLTCRHPTGPEPMRPAKPDQPARAVPARVTSLPARLVRPRLALSFSPLPAEVISEYPWRHLKERSKP